MSHQSTTGRSNRTIIAIVVAAIVVLAFGGGYLLARGGSSTAEPTPTGSLSGHPKPTHSPKPTATPTDSPSPQPAGDLQDGRYFVYVKKVDGTTPLMLTFDLAYFYTGNKANQIAASRGDEVPVPNDVYIVNDNAKLRRYPIASPVLVRYIPSGSALKTGDISAFEQAVNGTAQGDYPDMSYTGWWILIANGEIQSIKQQYLP